MTKFLKADNTAGTDLCKEAPRQKHSGEMIKKETVHDENSQRLTIVKFPEHEQT
jgi:hypothetical protein